MAESDEEYNKKVFGKIRNMMKPKQKEPDDNSPDSKEDKILMKDLSKKMQNNEIPSDTVRDFSGKAIPEESKYWNTKALIDKGIIGSGTVRQLYKKIKKSNPI